jgi:hypothetical protein
MERKSSRRREVCWGGRGERRAEGVEVLMQEGVRSASRT